MSGRPLRLFLAAVLATTAIPAGATLAQAPTAAAPVDQARDRQSILAMAGDYRVRFDMRETASFVADYKPLEPKTSGGFESVRVVEDSPGRIVLQHLLVAEHEGKTFVIKHWRQDWVYEPAAVLTYQSAGRWAVTPVADGQRKGAWSQTVWQTDDSPRYGGIGRWTYDNGVASWQSDVTKRPLARRDAVRKPPYAWYEGFNRHALTPAGWIHEQDNTKVGVVGGKPQTYVHEVVLNTYAKNGAYKVEAADTYWNATKGYWAAVRQAWDAAIAKDRGVAVTEEAENGSVTGPRLMALADEIAKGAKDERAAVAEAKILIAGPARTRPVAAR